MMAMRTCLLAVGFALFVAACSGGDVNESSGPQRPEPSEPASGPVVAVIDSSDTRYELHDEGEGCVAVDIIHPGLQTTVERMCFEGQQVISATSECGWLAVPDSDERSGCDLELPVVFYGQVTDPNIGFVCVGAIGDAGGSSGVTSARFVEVDGDGFILEAAGPDDAPYAHLFNAGGLRYGDPPLDAPSDPIYRLCEGQAPWSETALEYGVDLEVTYSESLRTDDVTVFFHSGLDRVGVSGGVFAGDESVSLPVRVPESSSVLGVTVETDVGPILGWDYRWPDELLEILQSGVACNGLTVIQVSVGSEVLEGVDTAIELELLGSDCTA
jgi:hypothetical protein